MSHSRAFLIIPKIDGYKAITKNVSVIVRQGGSMQQVVFNWYHYRNMP